jgi:hypothetical protein
MPAPASLSYARASNKSTGFVATITPTAPVGPIMTGASKRNKGRDYAEIDVAPSTLSSITCGPAGTPLLSPVAPYALLAARQRPARREPHRKALPFGVLRVPK